MFIAKLTPAQIEHLDDTVGRANGSAQELCIAFDPMDNSIKWKLGDYVWSPPVPTEER